MHRCARGGKIYWIPIKVLISSKGGLPKKSNTNSIFHLLYPLPCRKYMIKHFPHFICFKFTEHVHSLQSLCWSPHANLSPRLPLCSPQTQWFTLPASYTDPGPCLLCMPSITLLLATSPQHSPCAAVSFLAHRAALPPWSQQHTHTKPLLPIKHFILQNLTIKTNPYPANKLKTKAVP